MIVGKAMLGHTKKVTLVNEHNLAQLDNSKKSRPRYPFRLRTIPTNPGHGWNA